MIRRDFLKNSAIAASYSVLRGTVSGSFASPQGGPKTLKALGGRCGIHIGVQAEKAALQSPEFVEAVRANFDLMTPGNELKWPRLRPSPDSFNFADADWMVGFCIDNGLLAHGHNLCWNSPNANPALFPAVLNKSNAGRFLTAHIAEVMSRYAGRIGSWDVVNEPVASWSKRPDGLYPGIWVDLLGPEYIDVAFHAAAAADPTALRVLNTYRVEQGTSDDARRTRAFTLALLKDLVRRGAPIQAVGVESHLDAALPTGGEAYSTYLKQIRDMGLQLLITELDADDTPHRRPRTGAG